MKYGQVALYLTRRISAVLLAVGLLLPATCPAFVVRVATGKTSTFQARITAQAAGIQAPPCGPNLTPPAGTITATITLPSPITIASGTSNGLIGSSASTTVTISCFPAFQATTNYYDNFTMLAGSLAPIDSTNASPTGKGIMLQTSVSGIDVLLTASTVQASSGNNGPNGTPGWAIATSNCTSAGSTGSYQGVCTPNSISATFTAQLVKTGPVSPGTISSIQLLQFYDSDNVPAPVTTNYTLASNSYGTLTLSPVTVSMSACSVLTSSVAVTLPTIFPSALSSQGSVAGSTAFNIQYSCPAGWSLYMTMSTATPGAASGVILSPASCPSGTSATNVGVQLLKGGIAVTFNAAQSLGKSTSGTLTIPYSAQYYATGSPVGTGYVCATATFTMSYQ